MWCYNSNQKAICQWHTHTLIESHDNCVSLDRSQIKAGSPKSHRIAVLIVKMHFRLAPSATRMPAPISTQKHTHTQPTTEMNRLQFSELTRYLYLRFCWCLGEVSAVAFSLAPVIFFSCARRLALARPLLRRVHAIHSIHSFTHSLPTSNNYNIELHAAEAGAVTNINSNRYPRYWLCTVAIPIDCVWGLWKPVHLKPANSYYSCGICLHR